MFTLLPTFGLLIWHSLVLREIHLNTLELEHYGIQLSHSSPLKDYMLMSSDTLISATRNNLLLWRISGTYDLQRKLVPSCHVLQGIDRLFPYPTNDPRITACLSDSTCHILDVTDAVPLNTIDYKSPVFDISWDKLGNVLYSSHQNMKLRRWDIREGRGNSVISHTRRKHISVDYFEDRNLLISSGFDRTGKSEIISRDTRNMDTPLFIKDIGNSSSAILMFADHEMELIYQTTVGTRTINIMKANDYLDNVSTSSLPRPSASLEIVPKQLLDTKKSEVARFLQTHNNLIYPIHMYAHDSDMLFDGSNIPSQQFDSIAMSRFGSGPNAEKIGSSVKTFDLSNSKSGYSLDSDLSKIFLDPEFSDLTITDRDGISYPVHKAILAIRSPYWKKQLRLSKESRYQLDSNIDGELFKIILFYIYTDCLISVESNIIEQLIDVATMFEMEECNQILKQRLSGSVKLYVSRYFDQIKELLRNPLFPDIHIITPTRIIPCHRYILACRIRFVSLLLSKNFVESKKKEIQFGDVDDNVIDALLSITYTDKVDLTRENVMEIWGFSHVYDIENLRKQCETFLLIEMDTDSCLTILEEAIRLHSSMQYVCINFLINHYDSMGDLSSLSEDIKAMVEKKRNVKFKRG